MDIKLEDVVPSVGCVVEMTRQGETFDVNIKDKHGNVLQNLRTFQISNGDVLRIDNLGFNVVFDGIEWSPPIDFKKVDAPSIHLKRKMDIANGNT